MQRGGWQHKNTLNLAANPTVFLGPREHTCFGAYSELKRIWIGEKMYSTVMERTVETSEAGRTEWPSLESRVVPSFRWRDWQVMLRLKFHEQLNGLTKVTVGHNYFDHYVLIKHHFNPFQLFN